MFTNWSQEDFTGYWDSNPTLIKKGEMIILPRYLAHHFAKHLADRECNRENKPTDGLFKNECIAKCISDLNAEVKEEIKDATNALNKAIMDKVTGNVQEVKFCEYCDSKGGRHKADCKRPQDEKPVDVNPKFEE